MPEIAGFHIYNILVFAHFAVLNTVRQWRTGRVLTIGGSEAPDGKGGMSETYPLLI